MQPYFLPYIGYFQLMNACDRFVVYDNIQFTKKGWINRNRILVNGRDAYITLPLQRASDFLNVCDRHLSDEWPVERKKMLNRITESYRKAPQFEKTFPVIENILMHNDKNLFGFIFHSLIRIKEFLSIETPLVISSEVNIDHTLKSQNKVLGFCEALNARTYINPIGGVELYNKNDFAQRGVELKFLKASDIRYPQFENEYVPFLSIIDVMMFNDKDAITGILKNSFTLT
ncbi:MAG: WbqC-like protein family protein [Bacteroidetes bacterium]|nr:WbqC-like protein family protein [Bacteroidota bacterium]